MKKTVIRNKMFVIMLNVTEKRSLKEFVQLYLFRFDKVNNLSISKISQRTEDISITYLEINV